MRRMIVLALALLLSATNVHALEQTRTPGSAEELRLSFAPLVKRTAPAVVNIYTSKTVKERRFSPLFNDPFFRRFFGTPPGGAERKRVQNSLGSGVIVAADGLIVTNYHVIEGADEIQVVLADRREFSAEVMTTDERSDLALLRVDTAGERLPSLRFANSDDLEVGDLVLAIGNPFGVGQTVTSGIVSANARSNRSIGDGGVFIQTDAAVNPGNSGGALIDIDGNLVGVNTAIFSRSGGSHGIGFAIPSNLVRRMVDSHETGNKLVRPWLGAEGQSVRQDMAQALGMERPRGIILSDLHPKSPLRQAGLQPNDIVLAVGDQAVDDLVALRFRLETTVGKSARVQYWRRGETRSANVPIEPPPEDPPRNQTILEGNSPFNGLRVVNVSPAVIEEMGLAGVNAGVAVNGVRRDSIARRLGFRAGDVIEEVNGRSIERVRELEAAESAKPDVWRVIVRRDGKRLRMEFRA